MRNSPFATLSGSLGGFCLTVALTSPGAFALTRYQVRVLSERAADLAQVQTQVPDAYWVQGDEQVFILAGTFINRAHAQRRQIELERLGLQVRVVSREETDPPLPPAVANPPNQGSSSPAASSGPPETVPAATVPSSQPSAQRPFATQVPNPTQDPRLEEQVRRFFPGATVVEYQGQAALQTGEFSRLSLAQDQARWLTARGLPAVAVAVADTETQPFPSGDPVLANLEQGENYWVLVADPTGEKLPTLESLLTRSLPLIYDDLRVVRTGGFAHAQAAEEQVRYLASQGYEAGVFPADLRRSQPLLQRDPDPVPTPAAHSAPASPSAPPASEAQSFWVLVQAGEEVLPRLQQYAPDAFVRGSVIQVGTYQQRSNAEQAQRSLSEAGFNARIVAAEN
ncbi:sporulation protein [Synechococcus sp. Nb3U1]|uniref:sporulation protein n=1 Tax=Synechococcus sp. Nb3U1 TaxID=1914529 RepID=UPI001F37D92B|nr:sporulation protein [Synechococcus sp. Nb3U1]MCF2971787.1 sporulation protein [Synechococcus sp. Nb3U1]